MTGYVIKKEGENKYYSGSRGGGISCGFYGAKIYKQLKYAKEGLQKSLNLDKDFKIYLIEVILKEELRK